VLIVEDSIFLAYFQAVMWRSSLVLACWALSIHGRRVQTASKPMRGNRDERTHNLQNVTAREIAVSDKSKALSMVLAAFNSAAARRETPTRRCCGLGVKTPIFGRHGAEPVLMREPRDFTADEAPNRRPKRLKYGVSRDFTVDQSLTRDSSDENLRLPRDFTRDFSADEPRDFTSDEHARAPRDFTSDEHARPPMDFSSEGPARVPSDFTADRQEPNEPPRDFREDTPTEEAYDEEVPLDEDPFDEEAPVDAPPALFFATCVKGLEPILASELHDSRIGATDVSEGHLGVHFSGSAEVGARAVLWSRTALRIMHLLAREDEIKTSEDLYYFVRDSAYWPNIFTTREQTISVQAVLGAVRAIENGKAKWGDWPCPECGTFIYAKKDFCYKCGAKRPVADLLTNTQYTGITVKNAVVDAMQDEVGWRPSVDGDDADVPLFLHVNRGTASLYRVLSGVASMHKRGYRADTPVHVAALRETLAAGMLLHAGYDPSRDVLCDPMTGSGTIAIEAALIATNTAPGLLRGAPAFTHWDDGLLGNGRSSLEDVWWEAVREARALRLSEAPQPIFANDIHGGALELAQKGAKAAGVDGSILFAHGSAAQYMPPETPSLVVTNPPWDQRLEGAKESWAELAEFLKAECAGARAFLLTGNSSLGQHLRMSTDSKCKIENGGVKLELFGYKVLTKEEAVAIKEETMERKRQKRAARLKVVEENAAMQDRLVEPEEHPTQVKTAAGPAVIKKVEGEGIMVADGTGQDEAGLEEMFANLYS